MDTKQFLRSLERALKKGKLEGMKTSEVASKFSVPIHKAYGALSRRADNGFTDSNGRRLYGYQAADYDADRQLTWGFQ